MTLWNIFLNMDDGRFTKKVFNWDYNLYSRNWSSADVHNILERLEYDCIFIDQIPYNLKILNQKIDFVQENNWKVAVASKPKLRTYCLFKELCTTESMSKSLSVEDSDY